MFYVLARYIYTRYAFALLSRRSPSQEAACKLRRYGISSPTLVTYTRGLNEYLVHKFWSQAVRRSLYSKQTVLLKQYRSKSSPPPKYQLQLSLGERNERIKKSRDVNVLVPRAAVSRHTFICDPNSATAAAVTRCVHIYQYIHTYRCFFYFVQAIATTNRRRRFLRAFFLSIGISRGF